MRISEIVFFTTNEGKLYEAEQAFSPYGIGVVPIHHEFVEIQSYSLEEVMLNKMSQIKSTERRPFMVDDSGFFLTGYPDFPGVMSKFVYETLGYSGLLRLLPPGIERGALFKAAIGLSIDNTVRTFEGVCEGQVADAPYGETRLGMLFEPLFLPNGEQRTLAEMPLEERQQYSYRANALARIAEALRQYGAESSPSRI